MVSMRQINQIAQRIAREFSPRRITLFGSYAYGKATEDSAVDLLVLLEGRRVHDRGIQIRQAIDIPFPVDLLVRSPREVEQRIAWGDCFLREIRQKGQVLYEAADARVGEEGRRRLRHRPARSTGAKVAQL